MLFAPKHKHRLYIVFSHDLRLPLGSETDIEWALFLEPKFEGKWPNTKPKYLFYIKKQTAPVGARSIGSDWQFAEKMMYTESIHFNQFLQSRALVAKISAERSIEDVAQDIYRELSKEVPIVCGDLGWGSATWTKRCLLILRAQGGDYESIPQISLLLEAQLKQFAFSSWNKLKMGMVIDESGVATKDIRWQ
jgi:hypothetical protein